MPYESLIKDNTEQNFKSGYVVDVWHTLQEQLNFTWVMHCVEQNYILLAVLYGAPLWWESHFSKLWAILWSIKHIQLFL